MTIENLSRIVRVQPSGLRSAGLSARVGSQRHRELRISLPGAWRRGRAGRRWISRSWSRLPVRAARLGGSTGRNRRAGRLGRKATAHTGVFATDRATASPTTCTRPTASGTRRISETTTPRFRLARSGSGRQHALERQLEQRGLRHGTTGCDTPVSVPSGRGADHRRFVWCARTTGLCTFRPFTTTERPSPARFLTSLGDGARFRAR